MRPTEVSTSDLHRLALVVTSLAARLSGPLAEADAAARLAGAGLGPALRAGTQCQDALCALAAVVGLVARGYEATETGVAATFEGWTSWPPGGAASGPLGRVALALDPHPPAPPADLLALLARLDPDRLEVLLTTSPALARVVVDAPAPLVPGGTAALLAHDLAAVPAITRRGRAPALAALAAVRDRLARLDPRARRLLALLHPALLASAASAPPADRCAASRVLVAADLHRLLERAAAAPTAERDRWAAQVALRREWLGGTLEVRGADGRRRRRPHQLLAFDPRGDGTVVEVVGDLAAARHLAVLVPGTGSDLRRQPDSVARAVPFVDADPSVAVVVWQGADHPDQPFDDGVLPLREHVLAAGYRDSADVAGPVLAQDVEGLRLAVGPHDVTVLGHSYGGSIVGSAEAHGMVADRVVHVASAGAYVHDVRDYTAGPGATTRFSMTAYDDPIRLAQGHGAADAGGVLREVLPTPLDPLSLPGGPLLRLASGDPGQLGHGLDPDLLPGVVRLDTGRFDDGALVRGHSQMFTPGSTAWRNLLATMDDGPVQVLDPARWASHLEPLGADAHGVRWPRYVVDQSPWTDPGYDPPPVPP
jgi:hypothetical protein